MLDMIELPEKSIPIIFGNARYKILRGGRGSGKSWSFARALICKSLTGKFRVLCTREMQNSIKDSVYRLLLDQIHELNLEKSFEIQKDSIRSVTGSEFLFKGIHHNIWEIKSTEGIDICWVEEAERVSEDSWTILTPTIRKENSEIWLSFNPEVENSATYTRFVKNLPPDALSAEMIFEDNPWFPEVLRREMEYDKRVDLEKYEHVWLGKPKKYAQAVIFRNKFIMEEFEDPNPEDVRFFVGLDFGFAESPTAVVRCFIKDNKLFVDQEQYGHKIELNDIHRLLLQTPEIRNITVKADSARPDTISYLANQGFNIEGAEKKKGSVEDGIEFLRSFERIIVHPRCPHTFENFSNYKWKTDKNTGEILPIPLDASNDCIDALRYGLESYIKQKASIFDIDYSKVEVIPDY